MQKNHIYKTLAVGIIVLFIGVSVSSAISVDTKSTKVESLEDCGCYNSNYNGDYPPIICSVLRAMILVINTTIDVIGIWLISFGHTKDEVIKMLSPFFDFCDSLLELWGELNCPPFYT